MRESIRGPYIYKKKMSVCPCLRITLTLKIIPSGTHRGHNSISAKSGFPSLLTGLISLSKPGSSSLPVDVVIEGVVRGSDRDSESRSAVIVTGGEE